MLPSPRRSPARLAVALLALAGTVFVAQAPAHAGQHFGVQGTLLGATSPEPPAETLGGVFSGSLILTQRSVNGTITEVSWSLFFSAGLCTGQQVNGWLPADCRVSAQGTFQADLFSSADCLSGRGTSTSAEFIDPARRRWTGSFTTGGAVSADPARPGRYAAGQFVLTGSLRRATGPSRQAVLTATTVHHPLCPAPRRGETRLDQTYYPAVGTLTFRS